MWWAQMHQNVCFPEELWKHEFPLQKIVLLFMLEIILTQYGRFSNLWWEMFTCLPRGLSFLENSWNLFSWITWNIFESSLCLFCILAHSLIFSHFSSFGSPELMLFNSNLFIFSNHVYFSALTINDISMGYYCKLANNLACIPEFHVRGGLNEY